MSKATSQKPSTKSHPDRARKEFQMRLVAMALIAGGSLLAHFGPWPLTSVALLLSGLLLLLLTPHH